MPVRHEWREGYGDSRDWDEDVPTSAPDTETAAPAEQGPAPPAEGGGQQRGKIQDDPRFRDLDRETQRQIEAADDPWAALEGVYASYVPKGAQAAIEELPSTNGTANAKVEEVPTTAPSGGSEAMARSFAQPGTREAHGYRPGEERYVYRALPSFRETDRAEGRGQGLRFSPESVPGGGGGVGGSISPDYGELGLFGGGRALAAEDIRRMVLRRLRR